MEPGAAKCHRHYLSAQIKMPKRGYSCKAFAARVLQIKEYSKYLHYFKDKEGLPTIMKHANVPFNDTKISMVMLCPAPSALLTAYLANMGIGHFPTSFKDVLKELLFLKPEFRHTQSIQEVVKR